jgi:hypothetical protein
MNLIYLKSINNVKYLRKLNIKYRRQIDEFKSLIKEKRNYLKFFNHKLALIERTNWKRVKNNSITCDCTNYFYKKFINYEVWLKNRENCWRQNICTECSNIPKLLEKKKKQKEEFEQEINDIIRKQKATLDYIQSIVKRIKLCQTYDLTKCMCCIKKCKSLVKVCSNTHFCCEECLENMCSDGDSCKICQSMIINRYCDICNDFKDNFITDICGNHHSMCLNCLDSMMKHKSNSKCPFCRGDIICL